MDFWKFLMKNCRRRLNQLVDKPKMSMKLSDLLDSLMETYEHGGKGQQERLTRNRPA